MARDVNLALRSRCLEDSQWSGELYLSQQGDITTTPSPSPLDQLDDNEVVAVA